MDPLSFLTPVLSVGIVVPCLSLCTAQQVMLRPNGAADFQAAALVLESIGRHLQPKAAELNAASICYVMSSYVKCRCAGKEAVCVCWSVCGVQASICQQQ